MALDFTPESVLSFWFGPGMSDKWFKPGDAFDREIEMRFGPLYQAAREGGYQDWRLTHKGALALVLVFDQFPRNMFRGTPAAFATDDKALQLAGEAIAKGFDREMNDDERLFLYLPYQHAEDLEVQKRGLELFAQLGRPENLDYMQRHHDIIARFGRFPHRNAILGRPSTPEELEFLNRPGSSF